MRFLDFLRTSVLLFAGAANALAVVMVLAADVADDRTLISVAFGWWVVAAALGALLGRRESAFEGVARLLASARTSPALPELEPAAVLFNRLWGLAGFTLLAGGLGIVFPHVPAIAVGFLLLGALGLRKQAPAVQAIEERDGVRFYIDRTSAFQPTRLLRTPGFKRWLDDAYDGSGANEREPARLVNGRGS